MEGIARALPPAPEIGPEAIPVAFEDEARHNEVILDGSLGQGLPGLVQADTPGVGFIQAGNDNRDFWF